MEKNLYIDASHPNETRVVLKSNGNIEDYEYESLNNTLIKNNIYLGKVSRIEPSLQAAFVDFGRDRHGFLSFNDIQSDYYQLPKDDLIKIKKEEEENRERLIKESEINENNPATENQEVKDQEENEIQNDENLNQKRKEKRFPSKRYKIQEVIKPNQVILVQVIKEERGLRAGRCRWLEGCPEEGLQIFSRKKLKLLISTRLIAWAKTKSMPIFYLKMA